ncbi:efflux RND transporter periplasmic adaptor subunit [Neolewinella agarilytica]|uniref:efflux RND transporter periplasmic adaptor subunit n=1 Tax=Neolewinella agarilytica TaxID=478744 RepID=UPI002353D7C1|nr:HlyD family efflux transporter periplasmic adaptor subunit [Neolewinella agarilytica]
MSNRNLPRTIFSILLGVLILVGGYMGYNALAGMKPAPMKKEIPKRIKSVESATVKNAALATKLDVQGRLEAYNKIALFTEVGGTVLETGKSFKKGVYFGKGETLLRIDDAEARLSLQAQKATLLNGIAMIMPDLKIDYPESFAAWESYLGQFDENAPIKPLPSAVNQREKLFIAGKNLYSQYYNIKSVEERLSKYTLRAPFSGVLTSTEIDRGAVVRPGQQLGEIMATGFYEMVATVSLSDLDFLKPGGSVELYSEDIDGKWTGKIRRISDQIDATTQTVNVFIGVSGKELREGMYLRGEADARTLENVVEIDRDLLIDEGEVYVVENDTLLSLVPVVVRKFNRETVIVSGLPEGAELLTSDVAGAYDGMRVKRTGAVKRGDTAGEKPATQAEVPVSK